MPGTNKFIKFAILEDNATGYDTFSDTELLSLVADEENSGIGFGSVARTNILNGLFRQLTKTNKIVGDLIVNNYGADVTVETAAADNVLEGYLKQSIENISKGVTVTKDTIAFNGTRSGVTVNSQGLVTNIVALTASDIPDLAQSKITNLTTDLAGKVPNTRTVAGLALSADISRDSLIGVSSNGFIKRTGADTYTFDNESYTPTSRTIAGTALTSNISRDTLLGVSTQGFVKRTSTADTYEVDTNTYATTSEVAYAEIDTPITPTFWVGSQSEYDAIGFKVPTTVYIII